MVSTISVEMRLCCMYCLMILVYSSSSFCGAGAAAAAGAAVDLLFLVCGWAGMIPGIRDRASKARLAVVARHLIRQGPFWGSMSDIAFRGRVSTWGEQNHGSR